MPDPRFVECNACRDIFSSADTEAGFARWGQGEPVRLINNPAVWGADRPRYSLLGFSKGDTQNKAMAEARAGRLPLEAVPFKGMRKRLGWLLEALRIRVSASSVDRIFQSSETEIRSSSLIRCSISAQVAPGKYSYKLADVLSADVPSGGRVKEVLIRYVRVHAAPDADNQTFVMLGLDKQLLEWSREAFGSVVGPIERVTETTYRTAKASWVHVAHPSGNLTDPQYQRWCNGENSKPKVLWAREEIAFRAASGCSKETPMKS